MATGDTLLQIPAQDFVSEGGASGATAGEFGLAYANLGKGCSFAPTVDTGLVAVKRIPANGSFATGATFKLLVSDDPNNPCAGKVVKLGVNVGLLASNKPISTANLGTEATASVTLAATSGNTVEGSIPIVVANMASVAANTWAVIRIRRLGTNSADTTAGGRVLLHGVAVLDT